MKGPGPLLVKLGGSLITDKRACESVRAEVLQRVAGELVDAREHWAEGGLVLGHGSGSFGHFAAAGTPLAQRRDGIDRAQVEALREATGRTQDAAARLHRHVISALLEAGVAPYSSPPSGWTRAAAGEPRAPHLGPLVGALDLGLVPVVYGDVVMDEVCGAAILSTERVFEALARGLTRLGRAPRLALWLGETDGILDASGATLGRIGAQDLEAARKATGGSGGVDVTGGMRLRLDTAWSLALAGVPSLIVDGRQPGTLASALADRHRGGTRIAR